MCPARECALCSRSAPVLHCRHCVDRELSDQRIVLRTAAEYRRALLEQAAPALAPLRAAVAEQTRRVNAAAERERLHRRVAQLVARHDELRQANESLEEVCRTLSEDRDALSAQDTQEAREAERRPLEDEGLFEAEQEAVARLSREVEQLRRGLCDDALRCSPLRACSHHNHSGVEVAPLGLCTPVDVSAGSLPAFAEAKLSAAAGALALTVRRVANVLDCSLPYAVRECASRSVIVGLRPTASPPAASGSRPRSSSGVAALVAPVLPSGGWWAWQRGGGADGGSVERRPSWRRTAREALELPLWLDSHDDPQERERFLQACSLLNCNIIVLLHSQGVRVLPHHVPTLLGPPGQSVCLTLADCLGELMQWRRGLPSLRNLPLRTPTAFYRGVLQGLPSGPFHVALSLRVSETGALGGVLCACANRSCMRAAQGYCDVQGRCELAAPRGAARAVGRRGSSCQCLLCGDGELAVSAHFADATQAGGACLLTSRPTGGRTLHGEWRLQGSERRGGGGTLSLRRLATPGSDFYIDVATALTRREKAEQGDYCADICGSTQPPRWARETKRIAVAHCRHPPAAAAATPTMTRVRSTDSDWEFL
eukprot:TRINITY_DN22149_c0_g1_i2.p1 TRINITY_DN22149_c0_g1~~TRINITY_DN22149_c0_g1_i2.p1  ORF type:complete len:598 (+),score=99.18 TRINITY_DN22149_c0_g1_i2:79-1872(+)